jgi:hypothetical protein
MCADATAADLNGDEWRTQAPNRSRSVGKFKQLRWQLCRTCERSHRLFMHAMRLPLRMLVMTNHARDCLERAAFCAQLAEAENDPEMKAYLLKLAGSWRRAADETAQGALEDA